MYLNKKELDAIFAAIDFISTNTDAAVDRADFDEMQDGLRSAWRKGEKEYVIRNKRRQVRQEAERIIRSRLKK